MVYCLMEMEIKLRGVDVDFNFIHNLHRSFNSIADLNIDVKNNCYYYRIISENFDQILYLADILGV